MDEPPFDGGPEVQANAAPRAACERDVAVPDAHAEPDGRDPAPRPFDPPAGDLGDRNAELEAAEADQHDAVADLRPGPLRRHAEGDAQEQPRLRPDADGIPVGHLPRVRATSFVGDANCPEFL